MAGNVNPRTAGGWTQMMSTELNALAANTGAVQATGTNPAFDNTLAANSGFLADCELQVTFGVAPTAGLTVDLYLIPLSSTGGITFSDGSATIRQPSLYVGSFTLRNITTLQILTIRNVPIPFNKFIMSVLNNGDQAMAATGNTLNIYTVGEAYT